MDLPFIAIKSPNEQLTDKMFQVNRAHIIEAHNEDYAHIDISDANANLYPQQGCIQNIPQVDPASLQLPQEQPTPANEDSVCEQASTVDLPGPMHFVFERIQCAILPQGTIQQSLQQPLQVPWPRRQPQPASEFVTGYFSKSFPDLFLDGKGDITKPRRGKYPSKQEYFKHLFRLHRSFVTHHLFIFVATNMLRRHSALTIGNVFAKRCADDLSMAEMRLAIQEGNSRLLNKLLYFAAPIPGTRQYMRYKSDQALSMVRFVRLTSDDQDVFTFFQTFSAADLLWDDLHLLIPGSDAYLHKTVVTSLQDVPEDEIPGCIEATLDHTLRSKAIKDNADLVDWYFYHRVQAMLKNVLPVMGVEDHIVKYEVQARGTIHAHLLLQVRGGPSQLDLTNAYQDISTLQPTSVPPVLRVQDKIINYSSQLLGVSAVHPNPNPAEWPAPYGSNVHTPGTNILRQRFLELKLGVEFKHRYELLINRTMLHHCRVGYCLNPKRRGTDGQMICRFGFPMDPVGFQEHFSANGATLERLHRTHQAQHGAEFHASNLKFLRNHRTLVHHIPELLTIWGANVEGWPVQSYAQVIRYLLKYMMKGEPNSPSFFTISKAVVESVRDEEPVRKVFQKIIMKTVGEHDLTKQECHHILNGLEFMELSRKFVSFNIMGTQRVRTPSSNIDEGHATEDSWATLYWNKDSDIHYQEVLQKYQDGVIPDNPADINLDNSASQYTKKWTLSGEIKVYYHTYQIYHKQCKIPSLP